MGISAEGAPEGRAGEGLAERKGPGAVPLTVGVVGLGLIGGSMAKAYRAAGWRVLAFDVNPDVMRAALVETIDGALEGPSVGECDLVLLAVYPKAAIDWVASNRDRLKAGAMVIDCCGVKREVCDACMPMADGRDFTFVGGHPMAGTQYSGFKYARANLFRGAPMVLVPPRADDAAFLERIEKVLLAPPGFGRFMVTTAEEHDRRIAYTSQLAHVVSNAFIKSPSAQGHDGFSAGSYRDLTRVAWLNENMWTELFLDNADNLLFEVDNIIGELEKYRDALAARDPERLRELLREGRVAKERAEYGGERR